MRRKEAQKGRKVGKYYNISMDLWFDAFPKKMKKKEVVLVGMEVIVVISFRISAEHHEI